MLSKFSLSDVVENVPIVLDMRTCSLLANSNAYRELYSVYCVRFGDLTKENQRAIGQTLFKALQNFSWELPRAPVGRRCFAYMFLDLALRNNNHFLYILYELRPFVIMNCINDKESFHESGFLVACESTIWNGVKLAFRHNNLNFVEYIGTSYYRKGLDMFQSYVELAELIILNYPEPTLIKAMVDRWFGIPHQRKWTRLFRYILLKHAKYGLETRLTWKQKMKLKVKALFLSTCSFSHK